MDDKTLETSILLREMDQLRTRLAILERVDVERQQIAEQLREQTHIVEVLNRIGGRLAAELDLQRLVQVVTDETTELTGAEFGAFFYNVIDDRGESFTLYTISGVPSEAFSGFPMPRNTRVFGPTFRGEGVIRLDDVTQDPRYGQNPPYHGMPAGHLPVRSYLAVPVTLRSGEVVGGLFYGHSRAGVFRERDEQLVVGVAGQAATAIDNARLFRAAEEAQAHYRSVFDGAGDAILIVGGDGLILDANPAAVALIGHERDALRGQPLIDMAVAPPGWAEGELHRLLTEGVWQGELDVLCADGSTTPVEVRARRLTLPEGELYVSILRDISERRQLEQTQRDFTALVTHELRAPLTSIKGFAQLLERRRVYDQRAVDVILDRTRHLERIIGDLLDVATMDSGRLVLHPSRLSLTDLVRGAVERTQATTSAHTISAMLPDQPVWCLADGVRIDQILENLLSNAVKYSPSGESIEIVVVAGDTDVSITVSDHGHGIPPEALPKLFSRFYRVDASHSATVQGQGLGLFITRSLVEAHGGTIHVTSTPGSGSTFTVTLPYGGGEG